jgi:hypothetical protein
MLEDSIGSPLQKLLVMHTPLEFLLLPLVLVKPMLSHSTLHCLEDTTNKHTPRSQILSSSQLPYGIKLLVEDSHQPPHNQARES